MWCKTPMLTNKQAPALWELAGWVYGQRTRTQAGQQTRARTLGRALNALRRCHVPMDPSPLCVTSTPVPSSPPLLCLPCACDPLNQPYSILVRASQACSVCSRQPPTKSSCSLRAARSWSRETGCLTLRSTRLRLGVVWRLVCSASGPGAHV